MKNLDLNLVIFGVAIATALCFVAFMLVNVGAGPEVSPELKTILIVWFLIFFLPPFFVAIKATNAGALYGLVIGMAPVLIAVLIGYRVPIFIYFMFYMFAPLGGYFGEITAKLLFKP